MKGFLRFYWGRFLKLAPLYYIYLFLFELFNGQTYLFNNPKILLKILTFTFNGNGGISGMGHLWYISSAMQLYIIMPFLYLMIRNLKTKKSILLQLVTITAIGLFVRCTIYRMGFDWYTWIYTFAPCNIDLVVCGMLVACIKVRHYTGHSNSSMVKSCAWLLVVGLIVYNIAIYSNGNPLYLTIYQIYLPSIYILVCSVAIIYLGDLEICKKPLTLKTFFSRSASFIDWFSGISYAFYVFHIAAFMYASSILNQLPFYQNGSILMQFFIFYITSFSLALVCAVLFSKMTAGFQRKKVGKLSKEGKYEK